MSAERKTLDQIFTEFTKVLNEQRKALNVEEPQHLVIPDHPTYENLESDISAVKFFKSAYNLHICFNYSLTLDGREISKIGAGTALSMFGINTFSKEKLQSETQQSADLIKQSFDPADKSTIAITQSFKTFLENLTLNWNSSVAEWIRNFIQDSGKAGFEFMLLYFEIALYVSEISNQIPKTTAAPSSTALEEAALETEIQSIANARKKLTVLKNELQAKIQTYTQKINALWSRKPYAVNEKHVAELHQILTAREKTIRDTLQSLNSQEKKCEKAVGEIKAQKEEQRLTELAASSATSTKAAQEIVTTLTAKLAGLRTEQTTITEQENQSKTSIEAKRQAINKIRLQKTTLQEKEATLNSILADVKNHCLLRGDGKQQKISDRRKIEESIGFTSEALDKYLAAQDAYFNQSRLFYGAATATRLVGSWAGVSNSKNPFEKSREELTGGVEENRGEITQKIAECDNSIAILEKEIEESSKKQTLLNSNLIQISETIKKTEQELKAAKIKSAKLELEQNKLKTQKAKLEKEKTEATNKEASATYSTTASSSTATSSNNIPSTNSGGSSTQTAASPTANPSTPPSNTDDQNNLNTEKPEEPFIQAASSIDEIDVKTEFGKLIDFIASFFKALIDSLIEFLNKTYDENAPILQSKLTDVAEQAEDYALSAKTKLTDVYHTASMTVLTSLSESAAGRYFPSVFSPPPLTTTPKNGAADTQSPTPR